MFLSRKSIMRWYAFRRFFGSKKPCPSLVSYTHSGGLPTAVNAFFMARAWATGVLLSSPPWINNTGALI
jgi:hypothetical protein